jgi:O-antigen ligase
VVLTGCIGLALTLNGSVVAPYRQLAFLLLGLPLLATLTVRLTQPAARSLWRWAMSCMLFLLAWAVLQSTPLPFGWLAHPVWDRLAALDIPAQPTISVAPAVTRGAIPGLVLPFLVFAAMILLCQERREAVFAWKALAISGTGLAALAVVLEAFFPDIKFFSSYEVGHGSFNGFLVNRNTTAAFLGLAAFAMAGWLMLPRPKSRRELPEPKGVTAFGWSRVALAGILFLLVIVLITTRSRAGTTLALLCLTLAFAAILIARADTRRDADAPPVRKLGTGVKLALLVATTIGLFIAFGEPVISRMGGESEDGRWCAWVATLQIIAERPVVGLGFGTFADAFPQYRDPDCLGTAGAWTRAHNSHLEFLAGMGLIGGLAVATALAIMIRVLANGVRSRKSLQAIPILTLGALAFVTLHSVVDFPLQIPGVSLYFAALLGAGCAVSILTRQPGGSRSRRRSGSGRS